MAKSKPKSPIGGRWNIVSMTEWDVDYLHEEVQAFIEFSPKDTGEFHFGHVQGQMDCPTTEKNGKPAVEFTWDGTALCRSHHGNRSIWTGSLDDNMTVIYSTDGKGHWIRREWVDQCPEDVFLAARCQGVKGHKGVHWCYKPDGSFAWDDNDDDPQEDGSSGSTPPGHKNGLHRWTNRKTIG